MSTAIVWSKNPDGVMEWKDVKGIVYENGEYGEKGSIITNKSGKKRNKKD